MSGIGLKASVPEDDKAPLIGTMSNTVTEEGFAADAKQFNKDVEGSYANLHKMKLLWTNPSPTVAFAPQNVLLDLSKYDTVFIVCDVATSVNNLFDMEIPIDGKIHIFTAHTSYVSRWRKIVPTVTGIEFQAGYRDTWGSASGGTVDNTCSVPINIYGIKY